MPQSNKFSIDLLCPGCGRTGAASVVVDGIGTVRSVSAGDSFHVILAVDNSLSVVCLVCGRRLMRRLSRQATAAAPSSRLPLATTLRPLSGNGRASWSG
jgi:hypothetical protein